jgi:hypothetical protein
VKKLLVQHRTQGLDIPNQFLELGGIQALGTVGAGVIRIWVHFNHDAIGAGGDRRHRHGHDLFTDTGGMAGIDDNRQMTQLFHHRYGGKVEAVSGIRFEAANTPLTEHHRFVPVGHQILGGHQPFLYSGSKATLEHHGYSRSAHGFEQFKILHIPGTDLEHIDEIPHHFELIGGYYFTDHR